MAFTPITKVWLASNVGLTSDIQADFESTSAQLQWFMAHVTNGNVVDFSNQNVTFQRAEREYIGVPFGYDKLYDVDYLFYQNANYSDKYFYCRVTEKEYINPNHTRIYFEVDAFQTFLNDMVLQSCFVERMHVAPNNDWVGENPSFSNTLPENVDVGEYKIANEYPLFSMRRMTELDTQLNDWYVIVISSVVPESQAQGAQVPWKAPIGSVTSGTLLPLWCSVFGSAYTNNVGDLINEFDEAGKADAILTIIQVPKSLYDNRNLMSESSVAVEGARTVDGYSPYNAKLFQSPYFFYRLTDHRGHKVDLHLKNFRGAQRTAICNGNFAYLRRDTFSPLSSSITFFPKGYNEENANDYSYDFSIMLTGFPKVAWVSDVYANWIAQNQTALFASLLNTAISGAAFGGVAGAALGLTTGAVSAVSQVAKASVKPAEANGVVESDIEAANTGRFRISLQEISIEFDNAKAIDDYFTRYGYNVSTITSPLLKNRRLWNYTKCSNAHVGGSFDGQYRKQIEEMLNNGVTVFHQKNNAPVGLFTGNNNQPY